MSIPEIIAEIRSRTAITDGFEDTQKLLTLCDHIEELELHRKADFPALLTEIAALRVELAKEKADGMVLMDVLNKSNAVIVKERDDLRAEITLLTTERDNALAKLEEFNGRL